ncbi:MAG: hypothetical protein NZZ41_00830 [Candidatus Dojkabacteria bacterium]|nr:hypothetical protein [Candidatus Dojkabacteria bacterium]
MKTFSKFNYRKAEIDKKFIDFIYYNNYDYLKFDKDNDEDYAQDLKYYDNCNYLNFYENDDRDYIYESRYDNYKYLKFEKKFSYSEHNDHLDKKSRYRDYKKELVIDQIEETLKYYSKYHCFINYSYKFSIFEAVFDNILYKETAVVSKYKEILRRIQDNDVFQIEDDLTISYVSRKRYVFYDINFFGFCAKFSIIMFFYFLYKEKYYELYDIKEEEFLSFMKNLEFITFCTDEKIGYFEKNVSLLDHIRFLDENVDFDVLKKIFFEVLLFL